MQFTVMNALNAKEDEMAAATNKEIREYFCAERQRRPAEGRCARGPGGW